MVKSLFCRTFAGDITAIIASDVAAIGAATVRKTATEFVPASLFNLFIDLPIYLLKPR